MRSGFGIRSPAAVDGLAGRYQSADFEVTLYSQMKGEFPFVVVVHQVPAGMPPPASAAATGTKTP
ncbi:MAG: hypothetical protein M3Y12_10885 [Bacteroidota bacterium]|nr:hypothetical protein [Bacteroidota bacterium]